VTRPNPSGSVAAPARAVAPARQAVLLVNPRSGGGKADRGRLVAECRARGIEPVVLGSGDDLAELAEAAVARGADAVGMAGGDGSLGLVAGILARHGVAMVVVPAGTRNHLAMDLGLDRKDVIGALAAFGPATERDMDLGEVDGRVFVNNVSLGLYAEIIRSPEYRDAKLDTTLGALPRLLGPGSRPFDLAYTDPGGVRHSAAHVVQVSNNAYSDLPGSLTSRPRLDGGLLGVLTLELPDAPAVSAFRTVVAAGRAEPAPGVHAWEAPTFVVDSAGPVDAGIDGESVRIVPPLRFLIRPRALRVRVPPAAGLSPAAREARARSTLRRLLPKTAPTPRDESSPG
jgi:diacylglycerol kinase family enzyme